MKGVILASGDGTRLRPLTQDKPKSMLFVGGKPVLAYNIDLLKKMGISEIIITLFHKHKPSVVCDYFRDGRQWGVKLRYSLEEELCGSAGGIKKIQNYLTSTFVLLYGDNFSNCNLKRVLGFHKEKRALGTVVLFDRELNQNSGIAGGCVRIEPKSKRILAFMEGKGSETNYINAGIYILEPSILNFIPHDAFFDFGKDLFPLLLKKRIEIFGFLMPVNEFLFGIDTFPCYEKTKMYYARKLQRRPR